MPYFMHCWTIITRKLPADPPSFILPWRSVLQRWHGTQASRSSRAFGCISEPRGAAVPGCSLADAVYAVCASAFGRQGWSTCSVSSGCYKSHSPQHIPHNTFPNTHSPPYTAHSEQQPCSSSPVKAPLVLCSNLQTKTPTPSNSSSIRCGFARTREKCAMTHLALSMCSLERPGMVRSWGCITGSNSVIKSRSASWIIRAISFPECAGVCLFPLAFPQSLICLSETHVPTSTASMLKGHASLSCSQALRKLVA